MPKELFPRPGLWGLLWFLSVIALAFGCNNEQVFDLPPQVKLVPDFETNPPEVRNIFVTRLEKPSNLGNFLFEAEMAPDSLLGKAFAINLDDTTLVLRDDGMGGDRKAGDNIFSIVLKEDEKNLRQALIEQRKAVYMKKQIVQFINRSGTVINTDNISLFDTSDFRLDRRFILPPELFLRLKPFDPALKNHSLMITEVGVVEDPTRTFNPCTGAGNPSGAWTFGTLMREMASTAPATPATDAEVSAFVLRWLSTWMANQTVNGEVIPARVAINNQIIQPWLNKSAANGAPAGQLDMRFAPFKLLAIVNRLDLRSSSGYGFSKANNAGEGRFVFCALTPNCTALQFTVIFEYGINKRKCADIKAYAQAWYDLKGMAIGSPAYNTALQAITDQFTRCGTNPSKVNQSSLNQLRTNEIALAGPWELREFNLSGAPGALEPTTVKQEPAVVYNAKVANPDVLRLAAWANSTPPQATVPLTFMGQPFLGAKAHTQFPPVGVPTGPPINHPHHWNGTGPVASPAFINSDTKRHVFSLNTCSGCHGGETQTGFTHVSPVNFGAPAPLSRFLTGDPARIDGLFQVTDAANRPLGAAPAVRGFADLDRRADDLEDLVNKPCIPIFHSKVFALAEILRFRPVAMTH